MPGDSSDARRRGLGASFASAVRFVFGANPWPAAGGLGHTAFAILATTTLGFVVAMAGVLAAGDPQGSMVRGDFLAYITGAGLLVTGQAPYLYDLDRQQALQQELLGSIGLSH